MGISFGDILSHTHTHTHTHTHERIKKSLAFAVSQSQATIVMGVISSFVMIWILSGVFWWALFSSGFLTITHATFRDASMHQDGDDQVAMVGEVEPAGGEQVAFLGDPHV